MWKKAVEVESNSPEGQGFSCPARPLRSLLGHELDHDALSFLVLEASNSLLVSRSRNLDLNGGGQGRYGKL